MESAPGPGIKLKKESLPFIIKGVQTKIIKGKWVNLVRSMYDGHVRRIVSTCTRNPGATLYVYVLYELYLPCTLND
jgi:hypothetical protein